MGDLDDVGSGARRPSGARIGRSCERCQAQAMRRRQWFKASARSDFSDAVRSAVPATKSFHGAAMNWWSGFARAAPGGIGRVLLVWSGGSRSCPAQFRNNFFEWRKPLRIDELEQAELEVQTRIGLAPQIFIGRQQNVEKTSEIFFAEFRCLFREARALVGGRGNQIRIGAAHARDEQVAEMADRFAAEVLQILPVGNEPWTRPRARSADCAAIASTRSSSTLSATTPSSSRTCVSLMESPLYAMACSSSESPSRRLPSAARASTATAPGIDVRFSDLAMRSISPAISWKVSARNWKSCARDLIVSTSLRRAWWPE